MSFHSYTMKILASDRLMKNPVISEQPLGKKWEMRDKLQKPQYFRKKLGKLLQFYKENL